MSAKIIRSVVAAVCVGSLLCSAACVKVGLTRDNTALKLFKNSEKVCFSDTYFTLSDSERNGSDVWRQGMVSGNGSQGFISSGSPYSDSLIFQNIRFVMPNRNKLVTPDSSSELDKVRRAVIRGETVTDTQSYEDIYAFHPGGALRLDSRTEEKQKTREYLRYTNYETGEVGVYYTDEAGMWERRSFTSFSDDAVITAVTSPSGSRINMTISFDDPGLFANFGDGSETDCAYKTFVSRKADCIAFVGHYPDYEESSLKNGGWATVTYVLTDGGKQRQTEVERILQSPQVVSGSNAGIRIENAYGVYLITRSVRTDELGKISAFDSKSADPFVNEAREALQKIAERYSSGGYFDYEAALKAHSLVYGPQFNAGSLTLGTTDNAAGNDSLLKTQKKSEHLLSALAVREYYGARYLTLCCAGTLAPRLCGMWTGEFSPGWGGKFTMDANLNLQTSALVSANMQRGVTGYVDFILRQAPDWAENALRTHGFTDALQAPVNFDGDNAVLTESCYDYPFRYYNAGAAWLLRPLYEVLQAYGDMEIRLDEDLDTDALAAVLDLTEPSSEEEDESDETMERNSLDLRQEILLPLLLRSANYWRQLLTPEYYTDKNGGVHYEAGKTSLSAGETYCIVPGYSPENTPAGSDCPVTANAAIDIAACRDTIEMLLDVAQSVEAEMETEDFAEILDHLPSYRYDDTGAVKEWATDAYEENNSHRHYSHLYGVWPLTEAQHDKKLREAAKQVLENRTPENGASHALVHAALIAARLKDNETLTDILLRLEQSGIRYDSLLTNHDLNGGSAYCTDYAIGYLGVINEALIYSEPGEIELLPCVPLSGFHVGSLSGLATKTRATVKLMSWDLGAKFVIADITSDVEQELKISSPISDDEQTLHFNAGETKTVKFDLNIEVNADETDPTEEPAETEETAEVADDTLAETEEAVETEEETAA